MAETIQSTYDKLTRELYLNANPGVIDAAANAALGTLKNAPRYLGHLLGDYRSDLRRLPKSVRAPEGHTIGNPQPLFNDRGPIDARAKAKLNGLVAEVNAAAGQVTKLVVEARAAHGFGPTQTTNAGFVPILARVLELEQELLAGTPRLKEAIAIVSESIGTVGGGDAMQLPGWGEDDVANVHEYPVVDAPEQPWYMSLGGHQSFEEMRQKKSI